MKTLKEYIIEGILDIEDNMENLTEESLIEDFIKENYEIKHGNLQFKKKGDKYIVSTKGIVLVKNNNITALTNGLFEWGEVKSFYCVGCTSLQSLKGAPKKAGWNFSCVECTSLQSLKGAPKEVGGYFYCYYCASLKDLKGSTEKVGMSFDCNDCTSLKSLEGAPKKVGRSFYCQRCGTKFTEEDVRLVCDVKGKIAV